MGIFMPLITLTTDFGTSSPYVAAMKGVILSICPHAQLVDLGHDLPPQDVVHAAYFLADAIPYFPERTIHVCVVDPGVGTDRALLLAEARRQFVLAPDNGVLTFVLEKLDRSASIRTLTESKFWRCDRSNTFHGRDILAPVAGHLALDTPAEMFGPTTAEWKRIDEPRPAIQDRCVEGSIVLVDGFGNLISNITATMLPKPPIRIQMGDHANVPFVDTYAEALPGTLVALIGSEGRLEIALVDGNAAAFVRAGVGSALVVAGA